MKQAGNHPIRLAGRTLHPGPGAGRLLFSSGCTGPYPFWASPYLIFYQPGFWIRLELWMISFWLIGQK